MLTVLCLEGQQQEGLSFSSAFVPKMNRQNLENSQEEVYLYELYYFHIQNNSNGRLHQNVHLNVNRNFYFIADVVFTSMLLFMRPQASAKSGCLVLI